METTSPITVLIADDHPVMRDGLKFMIERGSDMKVVAEASDGADAIAKFALCRPDVVLMDLQMPRMNGLDAIAKLHDMWPTVPIIVLTTFAGDARASRAIALGATSYLLKSSSNTEIIAALKNAIAGCRVIDAPVARQLSLHHGTDTLSMREMSVLRLIAQGKQNRCIGEYLNISEEAVKSRVKTLFAKLNAEDRTQAVTIAIQRGFLDL
jgi:DNA-binding NarL/FixJ family response regulator